MPSSSFQYRIVVWILRLGLPLLMLLGGIVFAAHKGSLRVVEPLRWYGDLRIEDLSFDLSGNVRMSRLTYRPFGVAEDLAVTAQGVEITTPGLFWLVSAGLAGAQESPAEQRRVWAARGNGGELTPEPRALPTLDRVVAKVEQLSLPSATWLPADVRWIGLSTGAPFEALGCGSQRRFSTEDFVAMGVPADPLGAEFVLEANRDVAHVTLTLGASGRLQNTWDARLRLKDATRFFDTDWQAMEMIEEQWRVNDEGFIVARNRYCAHRLRLSRPTFVDRHVDAMEQALALQGIGPTPGMTEVYRRFTTRGGELTWHSKPKVAMDRARFKGLTLDEKLRVLDATLMVNGEPAVAFEFGPPVAPVEGENSVAATSSAPPNPSAATPGTSAAATTAPPVAPGTQAAAAPASASATPPPKAGTAPAASSTSPPATAPAAAPGTAATEPAAVPKTPKVDSSGSTPPAGAAKTPVVDAGKTAPTAQQLAKSTPPKSVLRPLPAAGEIKFDDLSRAMGRTISVWTSFGTVRNGVVVNYNKAAVTITTTEHGNEITLVLPRSTVKRVELTEPESG